MFLASLLLTWQTCFHPFHPLLESYWKCRHQPLCHPSVLAQFASKVDWQITVLYLRSGTFLSAYRIQLAICPLPLSATCSFSWFPLRGYDRIRALASQSHTSFSIVWFAISIGLLSSPAPGSLSAACFFASRAAIFSCLKAQNWCCFLSCALYREAPFPCAWRRCCMRSYIHIHAFSALSQAFHQDFVLHGRSVHRTRESGSKSPTPCYLAVWAFYRVLPSLLLVLAINYIKTKGKFRDILIVIDVLLHR